jgi:hypothetical protein
MLLKWYSMGADTPVSSSVCLRLTLTPVSYVYVFIGITSYEGLCLRVKKNLAMLFVLFIPGN